MDLTHLTSIAITSNSNPPSFIYHILPPTFYIEPISRFRARERGQVVITITDPDEHLAAYLNDIMRASPRKQNVHLCGEFWWMTLEDAILRCCSHGEFTMDSRPVPILLEYIFRRRLLHHMDGTVEEVVVPLLDLEEDVETNLGLDSGYLTSERWYVDDFAPVESREPIPSITDISLDWGDYGF